MKILLTGGAGYIGSHTAIELISKGYEPIICDNLVNSSEKVLERLEKISGVKTKFYKTDCCDYEGMEKIFSENEIDAVIHFAGLKAVGESVSKPIEYYDNNLTSTLTLLKVMRNHGVNNIIFSSSATVYGAPDCVPITESAVVGRCTNPYGWTKYMNEVILTDSAKANKDLSVVLLRYFNPVGAHKSGLIGESPSGIPNNLMPYISQVAVGKLSQLSVFGNDYPTHDGTGVRDYIHVVDLAKGHVCAVDYVVKNKGTEVFNLGTGIGYSVLDMVKAFENVNKVRIPYKVTDRRPGDIAECYADPSKAAEKLGWKAEYNLEDMVGDSWRWQKNNPNGYEE